jgi:hypothetical protein
VRDDVGGVVESVLKEKGYGIHAMGSRPAKLERPLVLVDAESAQDATNSLYPGLAGRVAIRLPGKEGPALEYVYYLPFAWHPDDREAQQRHVKRALEEALDGVPDSSASK